MVRKEIIIRTRHQISTVCTERHIPYPALVTDEYFVQLKFVLVRRPNLDGFVCGTCGKISSIWAKSATCDIRIVCLKLGNRLQIGKFAVVCYIHDRRAILRIRSTLDAPNIDIALVVSSNKA